LPEALCGAGEAVRAIPYPVPSSALGGTGFGAIPYDQWPEGWLGCFLT
jgi:hypothetical protein